MLWIVRKKNAFLTLGVVMLLSGILQAESAENPFESEISPESPPLLARPLRQTPFSRPDRLIAKTYGEGSPSVEDRIPGIDQVLTQQYIERYSSPGGIAWLNAVMRRGSPYLAFIHREIEARKLPRELLYLPVVESGYLSSAVSRSGAAGLWQFMKNSMSPYDMQVNEWMDERMDFWKASIGALRKLEENYRQFEDWPLALAAYNAGLGGVSRLVQRTGIKDYWVLSEKKHLTIETIHYVPKLLAVAYIISNPRRFNGIDPLWPEEIEWTRVRVGRTVDLELLAIEAGIDKEELKRANGELVFRVTPPDENYQLKVRATDAAAISAVLERKDLTLVKYYVHTIKAGDTLSVLALHYGISVDHILNANPGTQAQYLKIGKRLLIPAFKDVGPYQKPPGRNSPNNAAFDGSHLVKRGETLWSIALAYHVDPETLAEANSMGLNDTLREGRRLKTPIR
ncbi:MAG: LysM peptidoglycan-binding domain-containing protein [Treponema sp.]|jgi:membrane-bound lytic murein transglycosylase D|nr:LysM peptidoglycan-binding domain-containing protein [Treponema sp.]